jgi:beta propeller repeat protein
MGGLTKGIGHAASPGAGRITTPGHLRLAALLLVIISLSLCPGAALECPLSINPSASQLQPDISGDQVVWVDTTGGGDIVLYNITDGTETRLTSDPVEQTAPLVSGSFVAWQEIDPGLFTAGLILHDLRAGTDLPLAPNIFTHVISGDQVAWIDLDNLDLEYYSITPGERGVIVSGEFDKTQLAISGNTAAWVNGSGTCGDPPVPGCISAIFMKDLNNGDEVRLVAEIGERSSPVISGNRLAWSDNRDGNSDIYLIQNVNNPSETQLTSDPLGQTSPAIDVNRVAWVNETDIYTDKPPYNSPEQISTGGMNLLPRISGNRVVWQKDEGGTSFIALSTLNAPAGSSCPAAGFTADPLTGPAPLDVQFTDASTGSPARWSWDFGDGTTSGDQSPLHAYATEGDFTVTLTVSNDYGRDSRSEPALIHVGTPPAASFSSSTTSGVIPLVVAFSDTSTGAPTDHAWDFENDGTVDDNAPDPVHVYGQTGTYTVKLVASNALGSDTAIAPDLVWVMNGMNSSATTAIDGLVVQDIGGVQHITLDTTRVLANTTGNTTWLSLRPQAATGWQNITLFSRSGAAFQEFPDGTIEGDIGSCILESREIVPTMFLTGIGNNLPVSYRLELSAYPVGAEIYTTLWEEVTPADERDFRRALAETSADFTSVLDTAYTLVFIPANIPQATVQGATLNLSVRSDWVAQGGTRNNITVVRLGGDLVNQTLNPAATFTDPAAGLDFFTVPSPPGLSRFALVSADGSSNLIQMGTRLAAQVIQGSGGRGSGSSDPPAARDRTPWEQPAAAAQPQPAPGVPTFYSEAPIDTTAAGITRGAVIISAGDRGAHLLVPAGIEALDGAGAPLALVSVAPAAPGGPRPGTGAGSPAFTGIAYDLGPDGATFSPPAALTFTIPGSSWDGGSLYTIRTYDAGTGAWTEIPATADPAGHTVTGQVSHLCLFGVFAAPLPAATEPGAPAEGVTVSPPAPAALPRTPIGTFTGILAWVSATALANPLAAALVLVAALLLSAALIMGSRRSRITTIRRKK